MHRSRWCRVLPLAGWALAAQGPGATSHLGVPVQQTVLLEGVVTSATERRWTLVQGGLIAPSTASGEYRIPGDRKLVITDLKFTFRGPSGRSANVLMLNRQAQQSLVVYRMTARLQAGLEQSSHSEHFTAPLVLAEGSELSVGLGTSNPGVVLDSFLLYGYTLPAGR